MRNKQVRQNPKVEAFASIFSAFFQPARLARELQPTSRLQSLLLQCRLALPMFVVAYMLTLARRMLLRPFGLMRQDAADFFLTPLPLVAIGMVVCVMPGIVPGMAFGTAGGLVPGLAVGIVVRFVVILGSVAPLVLLLMSFLVSRSVWWLAL